MNDTISKITFINKNIMAGLLNGHDVRTQMVPIMEEMAMSADTISGINMCVDCGAGCYRVRDGKMSCGQCGAPEPYSGGQGRDADEVHETASAMTGMLVVGFAIGAVAVGVIWLFS